MFMKKEKIKLREFWPRFWNILKPSQRQIKKLLFFTILVSLVSMIGPYILKLVIDAIVSFDANELKYLLLLIFLFFASEQVYSLVNYFRDKLIFKILIDIEYYLPTRAQDKLVSLGLGYHEDEDTGNKIVKIERGINKMIELIGNLSWEVGPTLVELVITLGVLLVVDWRLALTFLFFSPLFIFITYKSNEVLYPIRKKRHREYEVASGKMGQAIININAVQSFVQEKREVREYKKIKQGIKSAELKEWFRLLGFGIYRNIAIDLGRVSILLLGVYFVIQQSMTIGTLVFVVTLSERAYFSLYRLSRFYDRVAEGAEAVNRFSTLLSAEQDIVNNKNGIKPKKIEGKIEFKNVDFFYRGARSPALSNVSLKINSGCITALVGPSGGGKTTIAKLVYRHYDPKKGQVFLDDKDIRDYDIHSFRKFLAVVPQEVEIFNLSVKENIAYARPGAGFEEIEAAAKIANAEEFIQKLEKGYDTLVGERGIKLSGGQRQRVGIARAILANPRILIFDEATSSLDSKSERLIQDAMGKISKNRTIIMIAHRLSTIQKADKIIVLEEGKVVEQGSHVELARINGGLYAYLLKLQAMGHVD